MKPGSWQDFRAREVVIVALVEAGYLPQSALFDHELVAFMGADSDVHDLPEQLREVLQLVQQQAVRRVA